MTKNCVLVVMERQIVWSIHQMTKKNTHVLVVSERQLRKVAYQPDDKGLCSGRHS